MKQEHIINARKYVIAASKYATKEIVSKHDLTMGLLRLIGAVDELAQAVNDPDDQERNHAIERLTAYEAGFKQGLETPHG
jgi:hypothetical protein